MAHVASVGEAVVAVARHGGQQRGGDSLQGEHVSCSTSVVTFPCYQESVHGWLMQLWLCNPTDSFSLGVVRFYSPGCYQAQPPSWSTAPPVSLQQGRDHALELHLYSVFSSGSVKEEDMPFLSAYILPAYMNVSLPLIWRGTPLCWAAVPLQCPYLQHQAPGRLGQCAACFNIMNTLFSCPGKCESCMALQDTDFNIEWSRYYQIQLLKLGII